MVNTFIKSIDEVNLKAVKHQLSKTRLNKIKKLKNKNDVLLSAAAELALNDAVLYVFPDAKIPVSYAYSENGKPYLTEFDRNISIAHSGKFAVCSISDTEVGVDIQKIGKANMDLAERFFSKNDYLYILYSSDRDYAFCKVWVKNESRVKLTGEGISKGLKKSDKSYNYTIHRIDDYLLCVCSK